MVRPAAEIIVMPCSVCDNTGWVCEQHPNRSFMRAGRELLSDQRSVTAEISKHCLRDRVTFFGQENLLPIRSPRSFLNRDQAKPRIAAAGRRHSRHIDRVAHAMFAPSQSIYRQKAI
jgi:hypothetical protein